MSEKVQTRYAPEAWPFIVPTLRRVIFGETPGGDDEILFFLALPALEALSLPMHDIHGDDLVAWFEQSARPLQDLALGWEGAMGLKFNAVQLCNWLRLIPSLTRFTMWKPNPQVVMELFAALADSPSLLPDLHDLTIQMHTEDASHISESSWRTFARALSTRRMEQLYIVSVGSPPADVLGFLRELVAHGATIHVGTEELNFVVA
ncbi:hypothetical protein C8R45DRAFT_1007522 [Mycena sanguinolenta]|nr:hypothetical protein C8R45DRAFT_1007522 [Mycena sanguinolenta]